MNDRFERLLGRVRRSGEPEALGEDMVPSPSALAERSALSTEASTTATSGNVGPFSSSVQAPVRDFVG